MIMSHYAEPFNLVGEGKYNLNVLRETQVTESFLGLDMEDRKCQNDEPVQNCTTRQYMNTVMDKCGCWPLNLQIADIVIQSKTESDTLIKFL